MHQESSASRSTPHSTDIISFKISLKWKSYTPALEVCITARAVPELITSIFDALKRDHGELLVNHALGLLTVARPGHGLSANEMEDILSLNDTVLNDVYEWWTPPLRRIPSLLWTRITTDLQSYLILRGADGGVPTLAWYHRQWWEAAQRTFVREDGHDGGGAAADGAAGAAGAGVYPGAAAGARANECAAPRSGVRSVDLHRQIAEYFLGQWADAPKPYTDRAGKEDAADRRVQAQPLLLNGSLEHGDFLCNARKLNMLPYHLARAEMWEEWVAVMTDLNFIAAKCALEDGVQDLLQDYAMKSELPENMPAPGFD